MKPAATLSNLFKEISSRPPRYPELNGLKKSNSFKSIQLRNQTPGSLDPFFSPDTYVYKDVLDPSHPATGVSVKFPNIRDEDIGVKIRPLSLLLPKQLPFPAIPIVTWAERVKWAKSVGIVGVPGSKSPKIPAHLGLTPKDQLYPEEDYNSFVIPAKRVIPRGPLFDLALRKAARRVHASLHVSTSKKRMGADRYMRRGIETRLRAAMNMIITRGASAGVKSGTPPNTPIVVSEADAGKHWIMQGWAYMFYPKSEVYNMPYPILITKLRSLLEQINKRVNQLERSWLNDSLLQDQKSGKLAPPAGSFSKRNEPGRYEGQQINSVRVRPRDKSDGDHPELHDIASLGEVMRRRSQVQPTSPASTPKVPKTSKSLASMILAGKKREVWEKELSAGLSLIGQRVGQELKCIDAATPPQSE
ncbi:hypothetical protein CPB84DRAFT_1781993 [Gymnopilus junonius]|uniref:Uncharacterized protein n=1 Tax=Gymnopilus junonius TaxID=109634 RepID=A0A9P5NIM7_GYMJU|nr:hypothetical protein CPB84DRAFT_1781993 [Gymnopilus junonius]